jgi:hypothetical protein
MVENPPSARIFDQWSANSTATRLAAFEIALLYARD